MQEGVARRGRSRIQAQPGGEVEEVVLLVGKELDPMAAHIGSANGPLSGKLAFDAEIPFLGVGRDQILRHALDRRLRIQHGCHRGNEACCVG